MFNFFILLVLSFFSLNAHAYPNFIGYGYTTCSVCHYNNQGGGPLTDYGRALFSQEIAARPFVSKDVSDEELASRSGFIPGVELPYWFRPAIKYRGLWLQASPQSQNTITRWIDMQRDVNAVFALDKTQSTIVSITYGQLPRTMDYYGTGQQVEWISREHYIRFRPIKKLSVSVGLMDKVYGLRISDHTSVSRSGIGLGQNDQVDGIYTQWSESGWDVGFHFFVGNLMQESALRQKGFSLMTEMDIAEKNRLGFSLIQFENDISQARRAAIHDRWGLSNSPGSSLMAELGWKEDKNKASGAALGGSYGFIEGLFRIKRGYNIISTIERTQAETSPSSPDIQRWSLGMLMFPLQRTEVRAGVVQTKTFSTETISPDVWALQGQIHVSW